MFGARNPMQTSMIPTIEHLHVYILYCVMHHETFKIKVRISHDIAGHSTFSIPWPWCDTDLRLWVLWLLWSRPSILFCLQTEGNLTLMLSYGQEKDFKINLLSRVIYKYFFRIFDKIHTPFCVSWSNHSTAKFTPQITWWPVFKPRSSFKNSVPEP